MIYSSNCEAIPVYPGWCSMRDAYNLPDTPHLCEDDKGHVSFLSQAAKEAFLRDYGANGRRRRTK